MVRSLGRTYFGKKSAISRFFILNEKECLLVVVIDLHMSHRAKTCAVGPWCYIFRGSADLLPGVYVPFLVEDHL